MSHDPTPEEQQAALGKLTDNELAQAAGGAFDDGYWNNQPVRASINAESPILPAMVNPTVIQPATVNPTIIQSATINPPIIP